MRVRLFLMLDVRSCFVLQGEGIAGGEACRGEAASVHLLLQRGYVQGDDGDRDRKHVLPTATSEACETPHRRALQRHEKGEKLSYPAVNV